MTLKVRVREKGRRLAEIDKAISAVIEADTNDFCTLLEIARLDPAHDLRYTNLSGVKFNSADITGWDLSGTRLNGADMSGVQNIDKALFSTETSFFDTKLPQGVTVQILVN